MDFQSEKSFGKLRLRAFQPYHQILCMSKHVEDVEDRSNTPKGCNAMYVGDVEDGKTSHNRCILKYVEDVEDRSNTHKGCNAMYVEDVEDIKTSHNRCILKYVEDVEDRSNTHKGCNAMYVEDVKDGKRTYTHILAHNFLNTLWIFNPKKSFGKLRLRAFQPYHQILCMSKHVEDVEDRSNTPKGCNAMYVEDIEDRSNLLWLVLISSTPSTLL